MNATRYERGYPTGAHERLQVLLDAVCPCDGVGIGSWADRDTWRLDARPSASEEEVQAALDILATFDPWNPASGGVFDSGPALQEIREAYEDSYTDNEGAGDVGLAEHSGSDLGGDGGEHVEAGADADPDSDPADAGGFSAEPLAGDSEPGEEYQTETVAPANFGGVLVSGDPLKTAKNDAREELARKQRSILDQYPWQDNLLEFDKLQGIRWGIAEGSHPPFTDEQQAEFDALSTFASWFGRVNQNAFNITVQIDDAETVEAVQAIDIHSGWPD